MQTSNFDSSLRHNAQDRLPPLIIRQRLSISFFLELFEEWDVLAHMESRPAVIEKEERKLSELEIEAIEMFINFLRLIGLPKSIGEIYGLLFVSTQPLSMEAMMNRLNISLGAASQGLKLLRSFGAVKVTYQPGDRRDYYVADLQLSNFVTVFIKDELQPRMERSLERIKRMELLMEDMGPEEKKLTQEKINRLKLWLEKGQMMLPWVSRFLLR